MHNMPGLPVGRVRDPARPADGRGRPLHHRRSRAGAAMRRGRTNASIPCWSAQPDRQSRCSRSSRAASIRSKSAVVSVCQLPRRRGLQRHPADRDAARHRRARLQPGGARHSARRASARDRRGDRAGLRRQGDGRLRPRLSGHRQPPAADRLHRRRRGGGRRRESACRHRHRRR